MEIYTVTGRYMSSNDVIAYHLVNGSGKSIIIKKDKIVDMVLNGKISNLRIQNVNGAMKIRGKGVNINNLPILDNDSGMIRGNNIGEEFLAQYKITKRIMYKKWCVGYVITDNSGCDRQKSRDEVINLIQDGLILNAIVRKYKDTASGEYKTIIRGEGCDLNELPIICIDENGKVIVSSDSKKGVSVRAALMRQAGIVKNTATNKTQQFKSGDYLICNAVGNIEVVTREKSLSSFSQSTDTKALCDLSIDNVIKYSVEILGKTSIKLTPKDVKRWQIINFG